MGSKSERRNLFGAVLGLAALAISGGAFGPAIASTWGMWATGAAMVYSGANAAYTARQQQKKARDAMAASLEERKIMLRGGAVNRDIVYGAAWISGVVVFVREVKDESDPYFWLVLALPIAHEIHSVRDVFFGKHKLTPLDANGHPTPTEPFNKFRKSTYTAQGLIPAGNRIRVFGDPALRLEQGDMHVEEFTCSIRRFYPMGNVDTNPWQPADQDQINRTYQPPFIASPFGGDTGGTHSGLADPNYYNYGGTQSGGVEPGMTTGENTWQDPQYTPPNIQLFPDEAAYLVPGTPNEFHIPGNVGDEFTLTYSYVWVRHHMRVWTYNGTADQTAHLGLVQATQAAGQRFPQWTVDSRLRGIPYIVMRMLVDTDVFPNELENVTAVVIGKKVFDPRTGVTGWSNNPILCARDYAISECGVAAGDIKLDLLMEQANICEEAVPLPQWAAYNYHWAYDANNKHDTRYRFDGVLSTEAEPINNLGVILSSCDGSAVFSGPSLDLYAGSYKEPVFSLSDEDFASPPEIMVTPPRQELFNGMRVRYTNGEENFWPMSDAPPVISPHYQAQDHGIQSLRDIELPGVTNIHMATRVARQMLHKARNPLIVRATFKPYALVLWPQQTLLLTITALGMVNKTFRVISVKPVGQAMCEVELKEDAAILYDHNYKEESSADPTPNTILQDIRDVPALESFGAQTNQYTAIFGPGGDLTARCRVFWAPVTDKLVLSGGNIEVEYKRSHDAVFANSGPLPPTSRNFHFPVKHGDTLLIRARASNRLVRGPWTPLLKKVANDAPTPYVTGNLIQNASLLWRQTNAPATGDSRVFTVDNWTFTRDFVNRGELDAGNYWDRLAPMDDPGTMLTFEAQQTGYMQIPYYTSLQAAFVPVIPGQRMVAYGDVHANNVRFELEIVYYTKAGATVGTPQYALPKFNAYVATPFAAHPDQFIRVGLFTVVPPNAAWARYRFVCFEKTRVSGAHAHGQFGHPYFGRASPAQVQYPPFST